MKKNLLILTAVLLLTLTAQAQFPYTVTTLTGQTYTPLAGGTSFNGGAQWYGQENYLVTLPFTFKYGNVATTNFGFIIESVAASDTQGVISAFAPIYTSLADRGALGSQSLSPIRYTTTGIAPNRIFKAEVFNAGFIDEYLTYGTFNDSADLQLWLYETSNVVEFRYGPSLVTHPSDYFSANGFDIIGFYKNLDINADTLSNFYYLNGSSTAPTIDSSNDVMNEPSGGLTTYPANGTVYRFTPRTSAIGNVARGLDGISMYPSVAHGTVYVKNEQGLETSYEIVSVNGAAAGNGTLVRGMNTVNIDMLAPGTYLLKAVNHDGQEFYKFVKE